MAGRLSTVGAGPSGAGSGITQLTGDVTAGPGQGSQMALISSDAVTNAKLANVSTATFKGRTTAGTGDPEDLTATQATALLNAVVGDSGSGGTKGLVPAPGAGDAAAGKFLKADGTFAVPLGTAASGNATSSTAVGSEPGSPSSGDLDLYNNGVWLSRYSGSAWVPWGPIFPFTKPDDSAFAWVNQGGASVDATKGSIYLLGPATTGTSVRIRKKSISTSTVLTIGFLPHFFVSALAIGAGILLRESATGKILFFKFSGDGTLSGAYGSGPTSLTANAFTPRVLYPGASVFFFRVTISGSNYLFSFSGDGQHFIQVGSVAKTTPFTTAADEWGIAVDAENTNNDVAMSLLHFVEA